MIGGSTSNNVLLISLDKASQNTNYTDIVRTQIKQLYTNFNTYFNNNDKPSTRLPYISNEIQKIFTQDSTLKQSIGSISLSSWGTISDIQFSNNLVNILKIKNKF